MISGQLVEERFFDGATPVTFGQSLRCALSVPVDGIPREHVLFTRVGTRFEVHPPAGAELVRTEDGRRGKLALGEATILFQEVVTLRQSLADRVDRRLAVIVGASLLAHLGIAAHAWLSDVDTPSLGMSPIAQTYHHDMIDVTIPDEPITQAPGAATPIGPKQTPAPIVTPSKITSRPSNSTPEPIDTSKLASILTGDEGERGKGGMSPRQPGADLDQQIADARDTDATIGDETRGPRVDDRVHADTNDRQLTSDQSLTRTEPRHEERTVRIVPVGPVREDDHTTLTPEMVLERIKTVYMAGLQSCYRQGLKLDSKLSGRVAISFTVDARGKVIDEDASGVSSQVDGCIAKQMTLWRFPIPKQDGEPTEAGFTVTLALQPS